MNFDYIRVRNYTENQMDVSEIGNHYVLSFSNKEHIKVSEQAKVIIEKFDGNKTVDEIVTELKRDNISLNSDDIVNFINNYLIKNGLIENSTFTNNKSRLWFHLPLIKGIKVSKILQPLTYLYEGYVVIPIIGFALLLQIFF